MYDTPRNGDERLYQGDIVKNCKFYIPSPIEGTEKSQLNKPKIRLYEGTAMILTQSCDIDDNDSLHLAIVRRLPDFITTLIKSGIGQETVLNIVGKLKSRNPQHRETGLFQWFYLPPSTNLDESVVEISILGMVNKVDVNIKDRVEHLSNYGRHWLQYYLMRLWGRPFVKD